MRLNQFIFLLASTVFLGAVGGIVTSVMGLWLHVPWFVGLISGAFLATTSLMGFWAYLTLNFVVSVTFPRRVWRWAQGLILLVVLYDMLWWRFHIDAARHPKSHPSWSLYLIQGLWPLAVAILGAVLKRRLSGRGTFLPSVFYLYVFTVVDWLLVIRAQSGPIVNETGAIMMACNVYLLLIFGKLLSPVSERNKWAQEAEVRVAQKARMKEAAIALRQQKKDLKKAKRSGMPATGTTEDSYSAK